MKLMCTSRKSPIGDQPPEFPTSARSDSVRQQFVGMCGKTHLRDHLPELALGDVGHAGVDDVDDLSHERKHKRRYERFGGRGRQNKTSMQTKTRATSCNRYRSEERTLPYVSLPSLPDACMHDARDKADTHTGSNNETLIWCTIHGALLLLQLLLYLSAIDRVTPDTRLRGLRPSRTLLYAGNRAGAQRWRAFLLTRRGDRLYLCPTGESRSG